MSSDDSRSNDSEIEAMQAGAVLGAGVGVYATSTTLGAAFFGKCIVGGATVGGPVGAAVGGAGAIVVMVYGSLLGGAFLGGKANRAGRRRRKAEAGGKH